MQEQINKLENKLQQNQEITGTELLAEPVIISTTTQSDINLNREVSLVDNKSIEDYDFLLFTYGLYESEKPTKRSTSLIPVNKIAYTANVTEIQYYLNATYCVHFSSSGINFKDQNTLRIVEAFSSGISRKSYIIESIQGIK